MNTVVIWVLITKFPNPRKVCLIQVLLEERDPMVEHWLRIIFVEGYEKVDDGLLFLWWKF